MAQTPSAKRVVAGVAAGAVIALCPLTGPGAATAAEARSGAGICDYAAGVVTSTTLTLDSGRVAPGQSNTARATVSSGAGAPSGSVSFQVEGYKPRTVDLARGDASIKMPTDLRVGQTYAVTAEFTGHKCYRPSLGTAYVAVDNGSLLIPSTRAAAHEGRAGRVEYVAVLFLVICIGLLGVGGLVNLLVRLRRSED